MYGAYIPHSTGNDITYFHEQSSGSNVDYTFNVNLTTSKWYHVLFTRNIITKEIIFYLEYKYLNKEYRNLDHEHK